MNIDKRPPAHRARHSRRDRPPPVIVGQATDIEGECWAVRERQWTPHGFLLERGWRDGEVPGPGNDCVGAPSYILTAALADYLRRTPRLIDVSLPCGENVIRRLRKRLGISFPDQRHQWWAEHEQELRALGYKRFSQKYALSEDAVGTRYRELTGDCRVRHSNGWWRQPEHRAALLTLSAHQVAKRYGISVSTAKQSCYQLQRWLSGHGSGVTHTAASPAAAAAPTALT